MIKKFIDFLNEDNTPTDIESAGNESSHKRREVLDLLKAIKNGNLKYVKSYFDAHINDENIQSHIAAQIIKCVFNNQKDICEYLLNLEPINNKTVAKDGHIINKDLDFFLRGAISTAKDLNKTEFVEILIEQYDRNNVKYPSIYSGKEPDEFI